MKKYKLIPKWNIHKMPGSNEVQVLISMLIRPYEVLWKQNPTHFFNANQIVYYINED